jgi:hypothetical protein
MADVVVVGKMIMWWRWSLMVDLVVLWRWRWRWRMMVDLVVLRRWWRVGVGLVLYLIERGLLPLFLLVKDIDIVP